MPPREQPAETLDADRANAGTTEPPIQVAGSDEIAQAELRAEAARARAKRLRQLADVASGATDPPPPAAGQDTDAESDLGTAPDERDAPRRRRRFRLHWRWRIRRPSRRTLAAALVIVASLTGSGYIAWNHHQEVQ